jgi:hypothetical protein
LTPWLFRFRFIAAIRRHIATPRSDAERFYPSVADNLLTFIMLLTSLSYRPPAMLST